ALGFGGLAGFAVALSVRPVYSFLLATALLAAFTVLYSFTAYADRESFLSRLRPFVASQNLVNEIAGQPASGGRPPDELFEALCADILGARAAALIPSTRLPAVSGPALVYPRGSGLVLPDLEPWQARFTRVQRCLPTGHPRLAWAVPLWSAQGLAGALFLDEKTGGGPYSEEEIELAQAAGERLLDLQAGSELARLSLELLRQRVAQSRVLEGQSRRVLHDEVLPELHSSILYLSGLSNASPEARQAVETLSAAHRRISNLLRAVSPGTPARLAEDGLAAALRLLADNEFAGDFQDVDWQVDSAAEARARELPAFTAEVVYFAVRELLRNARKYARGGDAQRPLRLRLCLASSGGGLTLSVEDDGVGLRTTEPAGEAANPGGSGLRLHSAMLAAVGASLELGPRPGGGTRAVIRI
ncbi:MAG: ATP-binding protein, partial [Anaerolineae bacterium]|nr:ATP-binding protein [Anaerolineae bacterium]